MHESQARILFQCALLWILALNCTGCMFTMSWINTHPVVKYADQGDPSEILVSKDGGVAIGFPKRELDKRGTVGEKQRYLLAGADVLQTLLRASEKKEPVEENPEGQMNNERSEKNAERVTVDLSTESKSSRLWRLVPNSYNSPGATHADLPWQEDDIVRIYTYPSSPKETGSSSTQCLSIPYESDGKQYIIVFQTATPPRWHSVLPNRFKIIGFLTLDIVTAPAQAAFLVLRPVGCVVYSGGRYILIDAWD